MKHTHFKNIFSKVALVLFMLASVLFPLSTSAATQHYFIRPFRNGDTVYYDNSFTHWGNVRIYLFNSSDQTHPFEWDARPSMTWVENDIWKFEITSAYDIEGKGYNFLIFTDGYTDGQKTIDLGFVGNGYAYKVDTINGNICSGYWYLYDQSAVVLHYVSNISSGDTIYFDNSGTNWSNVYIYLFSSTGGTELFPWKDDNLKMTQVSEGSSIYQYYVDPSYNVEQHQDNYVIFTNGDGAQTINLGFISSGYAYKVESWQDGYAVGYWYVYDKATLIDYTNDAEAYLNKLQCLPESGYASLMYAIQDARLAITSEVPVETEVVGNTEEYWNQVDTEETHIYAALQAAKTKYGNEPTVCTFTPTITKTIVNPQTVYRLGDTVEFQIDIYNPATFAISAQIDEALSGAEFVPGSGYELISSQAVNIPEIAPDDTVSVYAIFAVPDDVTRQYTNTANISSATTSAAGYYLNPTVAYTASIDFDTESWSDVPAPTGVEDNRNIFIVVFASSFIVLAISIATRSRRKSG